MTSVDVVVVGGGQAGLTAGYYLSQAGIDHVIYERGRIGETWRSQRWDSFTLNTPNWANALPGLPYRGPDPGGFVPVATLSTALESYAARHRMPVVTGVEVTGVELAADGSFQVATSPNSASVTARCVVVASGLQNLARIPPASREVPAGIAQFHTTTYRNPGELPPGAALIIGSGQSGVQIAEELATVGRRVLLATGRAPRVRRRYRGRDVLEWWRETGFGDVRVEDLEDPAIKYAAQPQISGVGSRGHTLSLQLLAGLGVELLGRFDGIGDGVAWFRDDLAENVMFADEASRQFGRMIDEFLEQRRMVIPDEEDDPADQPDPNVLRSRPPRRLDLLNGEIGAVIWATGVTGSLEYVRLPLPLDDHRTPVHHRGVSSVPGLFFLGWPWLTARKSGILFGVGEDARAVVESVARHLRGATHLPAAAD